MKNTFIDLSIGFFDKEKKFIEFKEMKASTSVMQTRVDTVQSSKPAKYALEMKKSWFAKNDIKAGQKFEFVKVTTDYSPVKTSP